MSLIKKQNDFSVKRMCFAALLIGLSMILANVKVFQTIAFDSMPAFVGGILLSPVIGGIIGLLGHLFTALMSGFPFTVPVHILIAIEMFVVVYLTSQIYNKGKTILACIVGTLLNGVVATLITGAFMYYTAGGLNPIQFLQVMGLPLTVASLANIVLAFIIAKGVKNANIQI